MWPSYDVAVCDLYHLPSCTLHISRSCYKLRFAATSFLAAKCTFAFEAPAYTLQRQPDFCSWMRRHFCSVELFFAIEAENLLQVLQPQRDEWCDSLKDRSFTAAADICRCRNGGTFVAWKLILQVQSRSCESKAAANGTFAGANTLDNVVNVHFSKTNICSGKSWIAAATAKSTTYHDPCHLFFNRHGSESNRPKMNGWHRRRRLSLARRWITTTVHVSKPCFKATCLSEQVKGKSSPEVTLTYSNKPKKTRSREREKSAILKTGEYKQQKSLLQMRILLQWNLTQAVECPPGEAEKMQTQEHRQFTPVCLAVQPNRGQRVWEFGDRRKRC